MKFLLPVLGLLLLAGAHAQTDVDVEGLREVLLSLLGNGQPITFDSLNSISQSFSGVERGILTRYSQQLQSAKEPEELVLHDEILDVETFKNLLFNIKALGVTVQPKLADAVVGVIDDPFLRGITPTLTSWRSQNAVHLTDALKAALELSSESIRQVIVGTSGNLRERLIAKIASLPTGMPKTILVGLNEDLAKIAQQQGGTFSFSADEEMPLPAAEIVRGVTQVNKVLNREIVEYVSTCMKTMTRAQVKQQVQILLRKVYDNKELPAVLEAVFQAL